MQLTKLGHACVRLEKDGGVLVIDPGAFSGDMPWTGRTPCSSPTSTSTTSVPDSMRAALDGRARACSCGPRPRWPSSSPSSATGCTAVAPRRHFSAAGFGVHVYGSEHAVIHPDIPDVANVGSWSTARSSTPGTR